MNNENNLSNVIEIKDFEIFVDSMSNLYWIRYKENQYPIYLSLYQLVKIFEKEGIPITENMFDDEEKPVRFNKVTLFRDKCRYVGALFSGEDENDDRTLQECWVKLED